MLIMAVNNGYWTDIIATIATSAAVIIALINTAYTINKDRKNKQEYNDKTLYMLNLKTEECFRELKRYYIRCVSSEQNVSTYRVLNIETYKKDEFYSEHLKKYPNIIEDFLEFDRKFNEINFDKMEDVIIELCNIMETELYNHYSNLNYSSIKLIENRINLSKKVQSTILYLRISIKNKMLDHNMKYTKTEIKVISDGLEKFNKLEESILLLTKQFKTGNRS
ncbi:hypothetical protein [Mammaliicoccus sciuri]|uniref:hypothetical protein n=1 Tax=Mammaliicoccus sciuri TaxID=1296 RepID=UPI000D1E72D8|nr:hypothetical protein [Mammaliicoccus sciuri]PTJ54197.1 hypothetical protein BU012_00955 [Mammaliicoccus sciuri]